MILNEKLLIENIRIVYQRQLNEAKILLSKDLLVKLKDDDKERGFVAGTLFTIDCVGTKHVILKKTSNQQDKIKPDTYQSKTFNIDYKELDDKFELA